MSVVVKGFWRRPAVQRIRASARIRKPRWRRMIPASETAIARSIFAESLCSLRSSALRPYAALPIFFGSSGDRYVQPAASPRAWLRRGCTTRGEEGCNRRSRNILAGPDRGARRVGGVSEHKSTACVDWLLPGLSVRRKGRRDLQWLGNRCSEYRDGKRRPMSQPWKGRTLLSAHEIGSHAPLIRLS
jgi:hypothetical protein